MESGGSSVGPAADYFRVVPHSACLVVGYYIYRARPTLTPAHCQADSGIPIDTDGPHDRETFPLRAC